MKLFIIFTVFICLFASIAAAQRACSNPCPQGKICINGKCKNRDKCKVICGFAANICCGPGEICITDGCQKQIPL
uniref:Uncharacterized protein n=1 Tax=Panagrolaimus sp. PS1159 TaxID=55785 RepID=A0AC35FF03_9BILA